MRTLQHFAFYSLLILLVSVSARYQPLSAGHSNITHTDVQTLAAVSCAQNGSVTTQTFFKGQNPLDNTGDLTARNGAGKMTDFSALIQNAGTSVNFKVEIMCSMDGLTFVVPEQGGLLGTFTDGNAHFLATTPPLSPGGFRLKYTDNNSGTISDTGPKVAGQ